MATLTTTRIDQSNRRPGLHITHLENPTSFACGLHVPPWSPSRRLRSSPLPFAILAIVSMTAHLQSSRERRQAITVFLANTGIERTLPVNNPHRYKTPSNSYKLCRQRYTHHNQQQRLSHQQIRRNALAVTRRHRRLSTQHATETTMTQQKTRDEGLGDNALRLYSHLCRSAAIMSTILPRQKKESHEVSIQ